MDSLGVLAAVLVWLLIVGAALMRAPGAGGRSLVGAWLALTAVTMFIEFVVFFVILHILLFGLGEGASFVGLVVAFIVLQATPVAWAVILRRRSHRLPAHG
jgi:hypothetical protein